MIIESLDLKNYRNYDILNMNFDKNVNIIYGDNAQGKTNILESIYFCAFCFSVVIMIPYNTLDKKS